MTDLAKLVVRLEAQTAQYMQQLDAANRKLDRFTKSADISAGKIARGVVVAAGAAAVAFAAMGKAAIEHADKLDEMSQMTGMSAASLSQLEYAAKFSNLAVEDLVKGSAKLSKAMAASAKSTDNSQDAFAKLGIKIKNTDGTLRSTEDVLLEIADRFSKMENGSTKAALAMELLGKSGTAMIPFLNEGKQGIQALREEADTFGKTISDDTAKRAAAFNDNIDRLKAAVGGMVNKFIEAALPTLIAISERFLDAAKAGGTLDAAIGVLGITFKAFVTSGIFIKAIFQSLGRVIYGVGAALVRVAKGEFRLAVEEIQDAFSQASMSVTDDMEMVSQIWSNTVPEVQKSAKKMDSALEDTIIFNPKKSADKAQQAADAALGKIKDLADDLQTQVSTYGMADAAVLKYRLTVGDLSEEIGKAGLASAAYVDQILRNADALDRLKKKTEEQETATKALNDMAEEGKRITESLRTPSEVYADTIERLNTLLMNGVLEHESYARAVMEAQKAFDEASKVPNKFLEEATKNVQDILGKGIEDVITEGFARGGKSALKSFEAMLISMSAQAVAADIAGKLFGQDGVGGSSGGWIGSAAKWIGGLFGGSRDSGGRGSPGQAYLIGTGAQPEMFVPDRPGTFIPATQMGGANLTQIINVTGSVDQRTARQLALESSRRQRTATARLG